MMAKRRSGADEGMPANAGRELSALATAFLQTSAGTSAEGVAFAMQLDAVSRELDTLRAQVLTLNKHCGLHKPVTRTQFYMGNGEGLHNIMMSTPEQQQMHRQALATQQAQLQQNNMSSE